MSIPKGVLAEINKIRKSQGLKRLHSLRKGIKASGKYCPIAVSITDTSGGGHICLYDYSVDYANVKLIRHTNDILINFIKEFDKGNFPQFERKSK